MESGRIVCWVCFKYYDLSFDFSIYYDFFICIWWFGVFDCLLFIGLFYLFVFYKIVNNFEIINGL